MANKNLVSFSDKLNSKSIEKGLENHHFLRARTNEASDGAGHGESDENAWEDPFQSRRGLATL